ncbi:hypothetical protein GCM10027193_13930 [Arenimonas aestuarii]
MSVGAKARRLHPRDKRGRRPAWPKAKGKGKGKGRGHLTCVSDRGASGPEHGGILSGEPS